MERPKFRPPQLPHFKPILMKLETKKDIRDTTPHAKFCMWLVWDDEKGVCVRRAFSVTFCVLSFFVFLLTPTGHSRRPITTPTAPTFFNPSNKTWNQERYPGYDPTCKIQSMWNDGKGVCVRRAFSVTFCILSFLCILAHAYRSQQKTDHDRLWLKTHVFTQGRAFWGYRW